MIVFYILFFRVIVIWVFCFLVEKMKVELLRLVFQFLVKLERSFKYVGLGNRFRQDRRKDFVRTWMWKIELLNIEIVRFYVDSFSQIRIYFESIGGCLCVCMLYKWKYQKEDVVQ